ncbi:hypothetical protein CA51_03880 [Rosistilla oblonga]|uniref:hypothetical protein n=1 Tax=Rosistilla oblonga TaxID=2527990 RepID=UPI0011888F23|nr:hypothetical protein [Rosistilla oblonga]QDV10539.1 hypothetical protein CA51_03880 [Rosistilla oblonga]
MTMKALTLAGLLSCMLTQTASAGFVIFNIRNANPQGTETVGPPASWTDNGAGGYDISITRGGQKVGLGSSDIDGTKLKDIDSLAITRTDDRTGLTGGAFVAPYLNFWITDGLGKYAVVANEPSNSAFNSLFNNGYDLTFADLADKTAKIYETSDLSWLPNKGLGHGVGLTFADLADFVIQAPSVADFTPGWAGLGGGAPRELGTNNAYGVNWVFGDTMANYVPGAPGYVVSNASVTSTVPEPSSLFIACCGLAAAGVNSWRRKRAAS